MTTILLVEDDIHLLHDCKEMLELEGHEVVGIAENGKVALQILDTLQTPPDMIISNWMMPEMDGLTLLSHLKESSKYQNIPFALTSAKSERTNSPLATYHYLTKPFSIEDLLELVERLSRQ